MRLPLVCIASVKDGRPADKPRVILAVLSAGGISYALLQSLVVPALPEIQDSLHTSESAVGWILTAFLLSASVATPIIGRLGDMYGKERLLMIVLVALALGTLISAVASSLWLMLVGRVIQGVGGGIFPLAFSIIRDEFPRERVPGAIGLVSSLLGIGGGAGRRARRGRHREPLLPLAVLVPAGDDRRSPPSSPGATSPSRRSRRRPRSTTAPRR